MLQYSLLRTTETEIFQLRLLLGSGLRIMDLESNTCVEVYQNHIDFFYRNILLRRWCIDGIVCYFEEQHSILAYKEPYLTGNIEYIHKNIIEREVRKD